MATILAHTKTANGRYRAGKRFSREPALFEVTEEQEAAIRADPLIVIVEEARKLVVRELVVETASAPPKATKR